MKCGRKLLAYHRSLLPPNGYQISAGLMVSHFRKWNSSLLLPWEPEILMSIKSVPYMPLVHESKVEGPCSSLNVMPWNVWWVELQLHTWSTTRRWVVSYIPWLLLHGEEAGYPMTIRLFELHSYFWLLWGKSSCPLTELNSSYAPYGLVIIKWRVTSCWCSICM